VNLSQQAKNKSLYFLGLFCLAIVILLGILSPTPYFYIIYDAEPDYLANIVSTYLNGHPMDFIHPGLPISYLSSLLLLILPFNEDPEILLLACRVLFMVINFSLICLGLFFIHRVSLLNAILFISLLFILPASNSFIDVLTPNGVLVGIGLVTSSLGLKLGNRERGKLIFILYGVALAFAVTIKMNSILLAMPSLFASFFLKKNDACTTRPIFLVGLSFLAFSLCVAIITYPVLPMLPFWFTYFFKFGDVIAFLKPVLEGTKGNILLAIFGGVLFCVLSIFLTIRSKLFEKFSNLIKRTTYKTVYLSVASLILLAVLYNLINVFLTGITYHEMGKATRNSLPFIGFIILFLPRVKVEGKADLKVLIASAFLISLISLKGYLNSELYKESSKINLDFRSLIEESLQGHDHVVFFPQSYFVSKDLFILWSDYRFGDRRKMFEDDADRLPFKLDPIQRSLRILNSRYYYIPKDISSKFSYRYINKLLSLEYLPDAQRGILDNSLYSLKNKDICNEPYDSFKYGNTFSLVIPDSLTYLNVGSGADFLKPQKPQTKTLEPFGSLVDKEPGEAGEFINKLTRVWQNKCGFEVSPAKIKVVNNKKHFILEVKSRSDSSE
jgi:hypothetical protein